MTESTNEEEGDGVLIEACLGREEGALERLIEVHRRLVRHAIRTVLERAGAAADEDLLDDAFARVFAALCAGDMKALRGFRGRSKLGTFLVVIARRTALRALEERRPRAERLRRVAAEAADDASAPGPGPLDRAAAEEERAIVREAVAGLAPRDALVLRLFYESGLPHREIGAILKVPTTHVGQIISRAREKLRARLDKAGLRADFEEGPS